jgi:hypothetical protein
MAKLRFDPVTYQFYYQCPLTEYIVSADSSCLTPQRGCAERYQSNSSTPPRS